MARIKYSAIVDNIRGTIGGTTFQNNAYGFTAKKKPNIIIPNTPSQKRQQLYLSKAVRSWVSLTPAERTDWETWASTYPQYAKNNPSAQLSGQAVFTKVHVIRFMCGYTLLTAPNYIAYPPDTISVTCTLAAGDLDLHFLSDTQDNFWICPIFVSRPLSGAQQFVGSKVRYISFFLNDTDDIDIDVQYIATFGKLPTVGSRIAVQIGFVGVDNGQFLARQSSIVTITAP
jgi:hypothetical protein